MTITVFLADDNLLACPVVEDIIDLTHRQQWGAIGLNEETVTALDRGSLGGRAAPPGAYRSLQRRN